MAFSCTKISDLRDDNFLRSTSPGFHALNPFRPHGLIVFILFRCVNVYEQILTPYLVFLRKRLQVHNVEGALSPVNHAWC